MLKLLDKINVLPIVKAHVDTLTDNRTHKKSLSDYGLFFGVPLILALALVMVNIRQAGNLTDLKVESEVRNVVGISFAILVGLLFNVLLIIFDVTSKEPGFSESSDRKLKFFKEVYANLAFSILVALLCLPVLLASIFVSGYVAAALSGLIYYLGGVFVLTLLMVLKRIHFLFKDQIAQLPL